jgi:peptide/nickel transport system substrate-binding protein
MSGAITSFMLLYALHDAVMKPMPGQPMAPSLAEAWSVTKDGLSYEFVLRKGTTFHNGDPVTADDVRFSFERYRGADQARIKEQIAAVEVPDAGRIPSISRALADFDILRRCQRRRLGRIEHMLGRGEDGFRRHGRRWPISSSRSPRCKAQTEAFEAIGGRPRVKRLVFRVIPDGRRLAISKARNRHCLFDPRRTRRRISTPAA